MTVKEAHELLTNLLEKYGETVIIDERSNPMEIFEENGSIKVKKKSIYSAGYQNQPPPVT